MGTREDASKIRSKGSDGFTRCIQCRVSLYVLTEFTHGVTDVMQLNSS